MPLARSSHQQMAFRRAQAGAQRQRLGGVAADLVAFVIDAVLDLVAHPLEAALRRRAWRAGLQRAGQGRHFGMLEIDDIAGGDECGQQSVHGSPFYQTNKILPQF